MSCGCNGTILQGEQFCQDCMPDEYSWLIRVDTQPDPFLMDNSHAYITPDNTVFVLDHTRSKAVPISGGGGGIDLSIYALNSDLEKKVKDLLAEITKVNANIKTYTAGNNIEITSDNVINNTYDDTALSERITELELRDIPVYMAGQGITIRPDKTIDAEVTLAKVNEVVATAVADTEINLNSANLVIEGDNLVWKGTLNTGRQITSTVPLSSLNVNQSAIDELKRRLTTVEGKTDKDTTYTAGRGLELVGNEFRAVCQAQNLVVKYADDEHGAGFRDTLIEPVSGNLFSSLRWVVEQHSDSKANGIKLNVETTDNSMKITGGAVAGNDFVYARLEAEPNTEFTLSFDYTSSKVWKQYIDYLYFVASTTRTWGSHLKDLPSIKLPTPNSTHTTPQRFSMDFTVGRQGYIYLYVNHTNSTNYMEVEQTFSNFVIRPKSQGANAGGRAKYVGLASVCPDGTAPDQPTEYIWLSLYNETESKTLEELRKQIESNQLVVNQQINQALTKFGENIVANQGEAYTAGEGLILEGTTFKVDGTKVASKESLDNVINRLSAQETKNDNNTTYTIMKENSDIVLQGSDGTRSVVVDNAGNNADLTPINNRLTALENKQDRDTTYTAGRGIDISNNTISIDTSMKRYEINDEGSLGEIYTPSGIYSFKTAGPVDPEGHYYLPSFDTDGRSELRLNFTSLKDYIDKGDRLTLTELNRTDNKYNAIMDMSERVSYAVSGKRRDNKSVDTYVLVQFEYDATGVRDYNGGVNSFSRSASGYFLIKLVRGWRSFYDTIRLPHLDLELTLHGDIDIFSTTLNFYNCRCLVTTGKVINKVEYKEIKFLNNQVSFSRNIDGHRYTFVMKGKPRISVYQKEFER